jgi:hypothetical protein
MRLAFYRLNWAFQKIPPRIESYSEAKSSLYLRQPRKSPNLGINYNQLRRLCCQSGMNRPEPASSHKGLAVLVGLPE